jgi:hypothetical protein
MQRLDFIRACHAGTDSFSALCRLLASAAKPATNGFSVLTLLTCHLSLRSRAPRSHSRTVPDEVVGHLTALRQKHPDWGPKKLRMWLLNHHVDFTVPASTVGDILKREGLVPDRREAQNAGESPAPDQHQ